MLDEVVDFALEVATVAECLVEGDFGGGRFVGVREMVMVWAMVVRGRSGRLSGFGRREEGGVMM